MFTSRLFWKLFGTYAGLSCATALAFVLILSARQERFVRAHIQSRLHDTAVVLRRELAQEIDAAEVSADLQRTVREIAAETGSRITLVAADGTVLADSEEDPARMENHADRPELRQATSGDEGVSQRTSPTLGIPMLYLALPVRRDGRLSGFVRVALPMDAVQAQIATVRNLIFAVAAAVSLIGVLLTYGIVARMIGPLRSLTDAARAISHGEYEQTPAAASRDELGTLAEAFQKMSGELARRIEAERRQAEQLTTVLGSMDEGVAAIDRRRRVLLANGAACRMLSLSAEGLEGRPLWEVVRNPALEKLVDESMGVATPRRTELELTAPAPRVLEVNARRLPGDPAPGLVLVFRDVTELRRLERLRQDFVANVSHELKTPLAAIKGYAETLREGAIDDPSHNRQFVGRVEEQADRLHRLILDMLSLARIESGELPAELTDIPLHERLRELVGVHADAAAQKNIQLEVEQDGAVTARAEEEGLRQILDNLVDNAVKYTPEGGRVTVRSRRDGDWAVLEVEDNGIGIAGSEQERIFERFYRVDRARSRELGGTGLGLSIVKHLAQSCGGSVEVHSRPGRGSRFTVRLPAVKASAGGDR